MFRSSFVAALVCVTGGALMMYACSPPPQGEPSLTLRISPRELPEDGSVTATVTVIAADATGAPGTGDVTITAPAGALNGAGLTAIVTLANGEGTATYKCDPAADAKCTGTVRLSADWNGIRANTSATIQSTAVADGGMDGGMDGGGNPGDGGITVSLMAAQSTIFMNVGDFTAVTATAKQANGTPLPNHEISFSTNLGGFTNGSGTPAPTLSGFTDAEGAATVQFHETGTAGQAQITATHASGAKATTTVQISNIQQMQFVRTVCGTDTNCTIMGTKGSGFNEQAQVTFKVLDSAGKGAPNVSVSFSIPQPPQGTTVSPSGVTDAMGNVTATVQAGPTRGVFSVKAVVVPGVIEAESTTIGIRGAKASNQGFFFSCVQVNLGAYADASPPRTYNVTCDYRITDRLNNPVGTGTDVFFLTEAGTVPTSGMTTPFSSSGANDKEGSGTINFSTFGGKWPADDVAPLPADPTQFPNPRDAEPSRVDGQLIRNPRDGLVTIVAYLRGEEWYSDTNNNGTWDTGEQFLDQGEAFVDSNDNNVWDLGEPFFDDSPQNGVWDGANGKWDANTTVWTETRVLYTDRPVASLSYLVPTPFAAPCGNPGTMAQGTQLDLFAHFRDLNLNRPTIGVGFSTSMTGGMGGSLSWKSGGLLDGLGFGMDRIRVDATTLGQCTPSSLRCIWRTQFYGWDNGLVGYANLQNPVTPMGSCANITANVTIQVFGVTTTIGSSGGME